MKHADMKKKVQTCTKSADMQETCRYEKKCRHAKKSADMQKKVQTCKKHADVKKSADMQDTCRYFLKSADMHETRRKQEGRFI